MTPADLRDEVRQTLAAAAKPMGLADIAAALGLKAREDKIGLAKVLHQIKADGTIAATPDPDNARRFRYTVTAGTPRPAPTVASKMSRDRRPRREAAPSPLVSACADLEVAITAMVKDDGIMAVVRAYGALRAAMGR